MKQILSLTRKELAAYFGSPLALIFLAAFVGVTLFVFFWVETFFARGVADVRPLFRWMPLLLIFLVAALTMRQWSEEQHSGTLEVLLTLPVRPIQLVLGKYLAVMVMVTVALALTLPLPMTAAILGNLDWGPVIGGYVAALLLASAYAALGLFVSSFTDNQIVALISTAILGGLLYLVGSNSVTDFFGENIAVLLRGIATGSRFESIQRGVIDARDLIYYLSLTAVFLTLNNYTVERKRWGHGEGAAGYRRSYSLFTGLIVANLLLMNVWVVQLSMLRADLTQQKEYSLSAATKDLLATVQEPLLIRAYISEKNHPLLNPLRTQVADLLSEYTIAGGDGVFAEVVDPISDPELEAEANQTYGIRPTPLQVAGRYESSVLNAYFDILVRYGDQDVTLNFRDLIDVQQNREGNIDVRLRNPEYDLTSAIKKVVYGFQSVESVLAALDEPVTLTLYVTPDMLPPEISEAPQTIETAANDIAERSGGKFIFQRVNPDDPGSGISRQQLLEQFGLQPFPVSFLSSDSYYLHMTLQTGDDMQIIYPSADMSEATIRTTIETVLKRSTTGFLKTIGLWTPPATPTQDMFGQMQQPISSWNLLQDQLSQEYTVRPVDLSTGLPPEGVDALVVVLPENLTDKERYAIDQYLMRGGSLIVAAGNYKINVDQFSGGLGLLPVENGLQEMLAHYGVDVQTALVMDPQNVPFPLPVQRQVGGFIVEEVQAINFPYFVDVRQDGMNQESGVMAGLASAVMAWTSPTVVDGTTQLTRTTTTLMNSTPQSWLTTNTVMQPNFEQYSEMGFPVEGEQAAQPLAVTVQGSFPSFFKDKPSPLAASDDGGATDAPTFTVTPATIEESPNTARLIVFGSGEFIDDVVIQLTAQMIGEQAYNNLQLVQNAVDWAVEDADLLSIRARGAGVRLLEPLTEQEQATWEVGNYLTALLLVVFIGGFFLWQRRSEKPMELTE
jgi:ABC-2 type transport system permease protein